MTDQKYCDIADLEIRYAELDKMGIVHHSNYLVWLEIARIKWLAKHNIAYQDLEASGYFLPLVSANIDYLLPLTLEDRVSIAILIKRPRLSLLEVCYKIYNQHQQLTTKACTRHTLVGKNKRPVPFPKFLLKIIPAVGS